MGVGLNGAKKLMDYFDVETAPKIGTTVTIGKKLRLDTSAEKADRFKKNIAETVSAPASNPFEALQNQNRELSVALEEVRIAKENLSKLNTELTETNRTVISLYAELDGRALALQAANEALVKATEQADLANLAKSHFLSNMSHEIRTPLGVIQGFAELAMKEEILHSERLGYLNTIRRNSSNLTKLIGEVLDLSKVEAGLVELEITPFSLSDLVSEVMTTFQLQAAKKQVDLKFFFKQDCPAVIVSDQMRLRQILINVIGNALKFTSQGEVTLTIQPRSDQLNGLHSQLQFLIQDTGIGLTAESQARVFQPFVQADSSTTRKFGGTGLGLSLSKKLAQALGGDLILVESTPGQGSLFLISVKLNSVDADAAYLSKPTDTGTKPIQSLEGLNVLLVEDSEDNQLLFSLYLMQAGANVDLGSDGNFGVELARKKSYDVILMDVQMPNLDGYGATAVLRAEGCDVPIVALTAHAMKEDRDRALANGFTHYLTKPLESKTLVQTLTPIKRRTRSY